MTNVVYEVNLDVDAAIADAYLAWLRDHVAEILGLPGFLDARIFAVEDPPPGRILWCVHYRVRSRAALQDYFDHHAAAMRGDGILRFGDRFSASRRILEPLAG
ncbi:MAG: DUF4286 family protein [Proteobacteria bacterium]|nr:DUF4286 family protein [Pseudomonadota bacterium]